MSARDDTPEDFLSVPAEAGFPIDASNCAIARAMAVVSLLVNHFDSDAGNRLGDHIICNALWSVEGDLRMLQNMINSAWESTTQEVQS